MKAITKALTLALALGGGAGTLVAAKNPRVTIEGGELGPICLQTRRVQIPESDDCLPVNV